MVSNAVSLIEISIVVPVYNSAAILPELLLRIEVAMSQIPLPPQAYEIIFVDDCSADNSWDIVKSICGTNPNYKGVKLVRNFGQWQSTLAGISRTSGKYIVTIDDDLQYEPAEIPKLYYAINGTKSEVVYGMPINKYNLEGRNQTVSYFRKRVMHKLWNSPPTDSFRILKRDIVFAGQKLLPNVFIDAYIVKVVSPGNINYVEVKANKRYLGSSNVSVLKRVSLFLIYGTHFHGILRFLLIVLFTAVLPALLVTTFFSYYFSGSILVVLAIELLSVGLMLMVLFLFTSSKRAVTYAIHEVVH